LKWDQRWNIGVYDNSNVTFDNLRCNNTPNLQKTT
jgi:hypothetical protein